jgi:hypothetical protein
MEKGRLGIENMVGNGEERIRIEKMVGNGEGGIWNREDGWEWIRYSRVENREDVWEWKREIGNREDGWRLEKGGNS